MMKIVVNPKYQKFEQFIHQIPIIFKKEGTVIYNERNTLKVFEEMGISLCVKSFHIPAFFNKIVYGCFRTSKAKRSYEYGLRLLEKKISTPEPVAFIENNRKGLLYDSYYICINFKYTDMMRIFRSGSLEGREEILRSFAHFSAHIHEQNVLHKDYSPGNILFNKHINTFSFSIIDINRMFFGKINMKKGCENFCRLWGNEEMLAFIAREYAFIRGYDPEVCVQLTLYYHLKFWERYSRRHNGFKPFIDKDLNENGINLY